MAKRFFKGGVGATANTRLIKLKKAGYVIDISATFNGRRKIAYGITDKCLSLIGDSYKYPITASDFKSDSAIHDIGLAYIRERLENTNMLSEYISESMLHCCQYFIEHEKIGPYSRINSDAVLALNMPKKIVYVALEYEMNVKEQSRYIKKISEYYYSSNITAVLYICKNNKMEKLIREIDSIVGKSSISKVFTCSIDAVIKMSGEIPFINRNDEVFGLE